MSDAKRVSLDGLWYFVIDPENIGKSRGWSERGIGEAGGVIEVKVPGCWDSVRPGYDRVAWYEREFKVEESWKGKVVRLKFGAANYFSEVWVNGRFVGSHEGGYTPFEFDISDDVQFGRPNRLVVRILHPPKGKRLENFQLEECPCSKETWYYTFGGIWQSVELLVVNKVWVKDCFVMPQLEDDSATARIEIWNSSGNEIMCEAEFLVSPKKAPEKIVGSKQRKLRLQPGANPIKVKIKIDEVALWSPHNPNLYLWRTLLKDDKEVWERYNVTFGMRSFTVHDSHFYLNGERIILKGILQQPLYPRTLTHPLNREMAEREIQLAKKANFNLMRLHIKPAPPITLELADELGIMLYEEPPMGWIEDSEFLEARCKSEVRELIERDRNHPSVVMWGIFNERGSWDSEAIRERKLKPKLCELARQLDPTRVIVDDSGGIYPAWLIRGTNIYPPGSYNPILYNDVHSYLTPTNEQVYDHFLKLGKPDDLVFVSEFGAGGIEDLPTVVSNFDEENDQNLQDYKHLQEMLGSLEANFKKYNLSQAFEDVSGLCKATQKIQAVNNKLQVEAMRANPNLDGYCCTHLADASFENTLGMLDYWRNPKKTMEAFEQVNQPFQVILRIQPRNSYLEKGCTLTVAIVNDEDSKGECRYEIRIESPDEKIVFGRKGAIVVDRGISYLLTEKIHLKGIGGNYKAAAIVKKGGNILAKNSFEFVAMSEPQVRLPQEILLVDPEDSLRPWLDKKEIKYREFNKFQDRAGQVVISSVKDYLSYLGIYDTLLDVQRAVAKGSVAMYLGSPSTHLAPPFLLDKEKGWGTYIFSVFHYIKKHPIFKGLPSDCILGQEYCNICATETLGQDGVSALKGEILAGCFWYSTRTQKKFGWGADLAVIPYGKGKVVLSELHLVENLGKDPVAEKILLNLMEFTSG